MEIEKKIEKGRFPELLAKLPKDINDNTRKALRAIVTYSRLVEHIIEIETISDEDADECKDILLALYEKLEQITLKSAS